MYMCVSLCICVFVCQCKPKGKHACCSSSAIHLGFRDWQAAQDFPEFCLPLFPSTWDCKCPLQNLTYYTGPGAQAQVLILARQALDLMNFLPRSLPFLLFLFFLFGKFHHSRFNTVIFFFATPNFGQTYIKCIELSQPRSYLAVLYTIW